ncbi:MAG: hypothetical protein MJE68_20505 [Proteobacteria bacterium]|nr:hypothetical protein [Pseudomonadota bacterium]
MVGTPTYGNQVNAQQLELIEHVEQIDPQRATALANVENKEYGQLHNIAKPQSGIGLSLALAYI